MITSEKINQILKIIIQKARPKKIVLFGSYADGNPSEDSDLDILIIANSDQPRYKRGREIRKHLRGMKVPMDILVYTEEEIDKWKDVPSAFITSIIQNGKVVYE